MSDQATHVLVLRHGETSWNRDGRIQGHTDIALNARGLAQARSLAQALHDEPLTAIYSSDLKRARQTAEHIAQGRGVPVLEEPELRERAFGRFEGLNWTRINEDFPQDAARWRQREPDFPVGGGETLSVFSARCEAALRRLIARHAGASIAVVAHGGVLDCFYRLANGLDLQAPRTWVVGNATINRLLGTSAGFTVVGWNDDRHLDGLGDDDITLPTPA